MDFEENNQQQPTPSNNDNGESQLPETPEEAEQPGQPQPGTEGAENAEGESFLEMLEASFDYEPPRRGEIRNAIILQIEPNEIIVDMGAKQDGIVTSQDLERLDDEFRASLTVGQNVPVYVLNPRDSDGNLVVSINMGLQQYDWDKARELLNEDKVVEVIVTGHNRGGVLVKWNMLEGFIPSSHMVTVSAGLQGNERREALNELVGNKVGVKVIEVDQDRRRLIFSEREAQREWRAKQKARLLAELNEGDVVSGTVTGLRDFGAFVNLGGADGLIHVSELAWHRVDHPRDVLRVGQEIDVYVLSLDRETNRIALSRKRLLADPWDDALERYHEGMLVEGTVTNVVDFGAFIALDDGLEGLLHLSEMGDGTLKEPHSYVKKGDRLQLRISRLEPDQRRVGFTQRWGVDQTVMDATDEEEDADAEVEVEAEVEGEVDFEEPEAEAFDVEEPEVVAEVEAEVEGEVDFEEPEAEAFDVEEPEVVAEVDFEEPEAEAFDVEEPEVVAEVEAEVEGEVDFEEPEAEAFDVEEPEGVAEVEAEVEGEVDFEEPEAEAFDVEEPEGVAEVEGEVEEPEAADEDEDFEEEKSDADEDDEEYDDDSDDDSEEDADDADEFEVAEDEDDDSDSDDDDEDFEDAGEENDDEDDD